MFSTSDKPGLFTVTDSVRERIRTRMAELNLSARSISLRAQLSHGALQQIFTGRSQNPRLDTLQKIATALDWDLEQLMGHRAAEVAAEPGLAENHDAYLIETQSTESLAVRALYPGRPHAYAMRIGNYSCVDWGARPGDLIVVDPDIAPRNGDIVVAQIYSATGLSAETLIRQFIATPSGGVLRAMNSTWLDHPVLMLAFPENGREIKIMGVVVRLLRERAAEPPAG